MVGLHGRVQILEYVKEFEPQTTNGMKFFYFWVLYSYLVPITVYFTLDLIQIIHTIQITHGSNNSGCKVYEPVALSNLGLIDYAIIDTEGIITKNEQRVRSVYIKDRLYHVDAEDIGSIMANQGFQKKIQARRERSQGQRGSKRLDTIEARFSENGRSNSLDGINHTEGKLIQVESDDKDYDWIPEEGRKITPLTNPQYQASLNNINVLLNADRDLSEVGASHYHHKVDLVTIPLGKADESLDDKSPKVTLFNGFD